MGSRLRIRNLWDEFTNSEEKIANYILSYPEEVYKMTSEELAKETKTSASSIVRFARKLGYDGFQELKIAIAQDSTFIGENEENDEENKREDLGGVIEELARQNIRAIEESLSLIDRRVLDIATNILHKAETIHIFASSSSYYIGREFWERFIRIGKKVIMYDDVEFQTIAANNMGVEDVSIAISHSGRDFETYELLKLSQKQGARTISVTKYGENPISELAEINLFTTEVERDFPQNMIFSRIAQMTIIDILFSNLLARDGDKYREFLDRNKEILEEGKIK